MARTIALANALAAVMGAVYVICRAVSVVAPNVLFAIGQSWVHMVNLESIRSIAPLSLGELLLGFVSAVAAAWIAGYAVALVYNLEGRSFPARTETRRHGPVAKALS